MGRVWGRTNERPGTDHVTISENLKKKGDCGHTYQWACWNIFVFSVSYINFSLAILDCQTKPNTAKNHFKLMTDPFPAKYAVIQGWMAALPWLWTTGWTGLEPAGTDDPACTNYRLWPAGMDNQACHNNTTQWWANIIKWTRTNIRIY